MSNLHIVCTEFLYADTYDVQEATITEVTDTQVTIECTFATGSVARGCAIRFGFPSGIPEDFEKILRTLGDSPGLLPPTVKATISAPVKPYTVLVYDLEQDGSISSSPVFVLLVEAKPSPSLAPTTCEWTSTYTISISGL